MTGDIAMRHFMLMWAALAVCGCSERPAEKRHVIPVGFSGVYKVEFQRGETGGYRLEGSRYVFEIPEEGLRRVGAEGLADLEGCCHLLTAAFADGREIPLYAPQSPPADASGDVAMLLPVLQDRSVTWYAVGTHEHLTELLAEIRANRYEDLDRYLPGRSAHVDAD